LTRFAGVFDFPGLQHELEGLEQQASDPELWNDSSHAQQVTQRLSRLAADVATWRNMAEQLQTAGELVELAGDDPEMLAQLSAETTQLTRHLDELEIGLMLSGEYDSSPAFVQVQAGAGGVDSQDWAQMLERMYVRWAEKQGWKARIVDEMPGEEAGIKNATIELRGPFAYGYAKAEAGVHRLVRLSPFDQAHRRHTSFAQVIVSPLISDDGEVEIDESDLRIDTYRASGAGGQHVNKTDSAVRITHLPTGIVVQCQNERSQLSNKQTAMKILKSRLVELEQERREAELARERGEPTDTGFGGNAVRSYVLHPYQLVKDRRTDVEEGNAQAVLDGRLDEFIHAYLLAKAAGTVG